MASVEEQTSATHTGSTKDAKTHFAKNAGSSILFFIFNVVTSLYFVKFQLHHLGKDGYGIVGTASALVSYLQVLSFALLGTTFRFVTMNLACDKREEADSYASTYLASVLFAIAILLPICAVVSYFAPALLKRIPAELVGGTRVLFFLVYANFMLMLATNPYQLATYLKQRFDVRNLLDIVNQILRYSAWVVLFSIAAPRLWYIGVGYIIGSVAALIATAAAARRLAPDLRPSARRFDKHRLIELLRMGRWVALDTLGTMLYWSTDMVVITRMLGPASTGLYVIVWGFAAQLRAVVSMMGTVIAPTTVAAYARQELDALRSNLARAIKFVGLALALMLGLLCGLGMPFLAWWLQRIPAIHASDLGMLNMLIWLIVSHMVVNSALEPVNSFLLAANRLAVPCLATIVAAVLKIALSVVLIKSTNLGIVAVAIAGLVTFTARQCVFGSIYASRLLSMPVGAIYKALLPAVFVFGSVAIPGLCLARAFDLATLPRMAAAAVLPLATGTAAAFATLSEQDRRFIREVAPWRKRTRESS